MTSLSGESNARPTASNISSEHLKETLAAGKHLDVHASEDEDLCQGQEDHEDLDGREDNEIISHREDDSEDTNEGEGGGEDSESEASQDLFSDLDSWRRKRKSMAPIIPFIWPHYRKFLRDEAWKKPFSEFNDEDPYREVDYPPDTFADWWLNELSKRGPRYASSIRNGNIDYSNDIQISYDKYLEEYEEERWFGEVAWERWRNE